MVTIISLCNYIQTPNYPFFLHRINHDLKIPLLKSLEHETLQYFISDPVDLLLSFFVDLCLLSRIIYPLLVEGILS